MSQGLACNIWRARQDQRHKDIAPAADQVMRSFRLLSGRLMIGLYNTSKAQFEGAKPASDKASFRCLWRPHKLAGSVPAQKTALRGGEGR